MDKVRSTNTRLEGMMPYDPKYLPASALLSANENPDDVSLDIRKAIQSRLSDLAFNRYPDPLAKELKAQIADAYGLDEKQVLLGNGGDELLFNMALGWGGCGRKCLNFPPTFSVYAQNARLTDTEVIDIARKDDFSLDESAILERASQGDIDFLILSSPNNPTGDVSREEFILTLLDVTDALVMVDEAYAEFSQESMVSHLAQHKNLVLLRTFSKAYSLAGVRLGYIMAHEEVIQEFIKVRQPYSVDSISQLVGSCVFERRAEFASRIEKIIEERERVYAELVALDEITPFPSEANYLLFKVSKAQEVWAALYDCGVLVRDFSQSERLEDCLRVTIGSVQENDMFLKELTRVLHERRA